MNKKSLLVLDCASSHTNEIIMDYLDKNGINYTFIPGGLTSKLQPLDISVNKPFKIAYKKNILNMWYLILKIFLKM